MTISALPMALLELCFKHNFNLCNKCNAYTYKKSLIECLTIHTPERRKCLKVGPTIFVIFEFIVVNIRN